MKKRGTTMANQIGYPYPVTNWDIYNFSDCFGSLYMFLEGMSAEKVEYYCCKQEKGDCYGCKHNMCRKTGFSPARIHEVLYHTFETLSGTNSAIKACGRDSEISKAIRDTDDTIDFILKYTGYAYEKHTCDFAAQVAKSIDAGVPVLARLKDNHFRILIGYDGNSFLALEKPENRVLAAKELDSIYVIAGKTERTYFLVDALKRIRHVLGCNRKEKIWDEYIESFRYWGKGNLEYASFKELKSRFFNLREAITFWCHSFAETVRHKIFAELKDKRLAKAMNDIDAAYDDSHTAGWQAHSLYNFRDWSKRQDGSNEWGYCELGADVARRLQKDDDLVYDAVCGMIAILEGAQ